MTRVARSFSVSEKGGGGGGGKGWRAISGTFRDRQRRARNATQNTAAATSGCPNTPPPPSPRVPIPFPVTHPQLIQKPSAPKQEGAGGTAPHAPNPNPALTPGLWPRGSSSPPRAAFPRPQPLTSSSAGRSGVSFAAPAMAKRTAHPRPTPACPGRGGGGKERDSGWRPPSPSRSAPEGPRRDRCPPGSGGEIPRERSPLRARAAQPSPPSPLRAAGTPPHPPSLHATSTAERSGAAPRRSLLRGLPREPSVR